MTPHQAIQLALQHQRSGDLRSAEIVCRQVLAADPSHSDALQLLGIIAAQAGRPDVASDLLSRAAGIDSGNAKLFNNLGNVLAAQHRFAEAEDAYRRALALSNDLIEAKINLGAMLAEQGKHAEAIPVIRETIAERPTFAEAFNNLAISLLATGHADEAIVAADEALRLRPQYAEALSNRGNALRHKGSCEQAITTYEAALRLKPDLHEARNNYAACLHELGRHDEAVQQYRTTIAASPQFLDARLNLGNLLEELGQPQQAIAEYRAAITDCPNPAGAYNNLGVTYMNLSQIGDAIDALREAKRHDPRCAEIRSNLANALCKQGRLEEAVEEYRGAVEVDSHAHRSHSNLLLAMHFDDRFSPDEIFQAHVQWAQQHAAGLAPVAPAANSKDPQKRLKIAYVSADLHLHPVARFLLPLLQHRNRDAFEVTCYSGVTETDALTDELQRLSDHWRSVAHLPDDELADLIRRDGIDILVGLSGHTAHHRLLVFARKPAPVLVTFLGYPDTTGLTTIDYRIVDPVSDPSDEGDERHTERLFRLDGPFLCYVHPPGTIVTPPPSEKNGFVTFCSFNNLSKISPRTMRAWAKLLDAVPTARLLIKAMALGDDATRNVLRDGLRCAGTALERVDLFPPANRFIDHLNAYAQADIALDTFPYNGTTTTCEALAMGVPVIALEGQTHVSRMGASILTHAGVPELIAKTEDDYVKLAAALAEDAGQISDLRRTLPNRLAQSALCDGARVTRSIESAYREMWRRFCEGSITPRV